MLVAQQALPARLYYYLALYLPARRGTSCIHPLAPPDKLAPVGMPKEVTLEDKTAAEQMRLIAELDEKDKSVVLGMIETMLTKKKFKDFFNNNIAAL